MKITFEVFNEAHQELYDIGKCPLCGCFPVMYTCEWHHDGKIWYRGDIQCPTSGCNPFKCARMDADKNTAENVAISKWQDWTGNK